MMYDKKALGKLLAALLVGLIGAVGTLVPASQCGTADANCIC
jgi:hypothetical protein